MRIQVEGTPVREAARAMLLVMTGQLNEQIKLLDKEIEQRAREDEAVRRFLTIPGIGPITATALLICLADRPDSQELPCSYIRQSQKCAR